MKIKVEIEIKGIEDWDVDWNNKDNVKRELKLLSSQIKTRLAGDGWLGDYNNIEVKSELLD